MTEPYFDDGTVTLYLGDCLELAEVWTDADVLVTDPPYGVDYQSGSRREKLASSILNDKDTTVRDSVLALWGDKPALVFGSWKIKRPEGTHTRLIWDTKGALGMGDLTIPWKPSDQEIYVLGRDGWTGSRDSNVLRFAPVQSMARNGRVHPHEKPLALLEALICKSTGVVADPTAGSGSALVAAQRLGRRAVGVELEEKYCEIAARRLSQQTLGIEVAS